MEITRYEKPYRYPPANRCIYCGTTEGRLTDEHIIPEGLAGNLILPKASCDGCQKVTTSIEGFVLREMFGAARAHMLIPFKRKRRPKGRITSLPVNTISEDGIQTTRFIPVDEHPFWLTMYRLAPPRALTGEPFSNQFVVQFPGISAMDVTTAERAKKFGPSLTVPTKLSFDRLCLFLAKIGHSLACADPDPDYNPFVPLLGDLIRTRSPAIANYVGCTEFNLPDLSVDEGLTSAGLMWRRSVTPNLLVAHIKLFANLRMPTYEVVVGRAP